MSVTATVIVPTHDHGPTLRYALASARAQTVTDLEVLVIGEAVPELTRELVGDIARRDERVRFFDRPKGERHGELYRHEVLADARGEIVCYLCDDDLWLPNHVELVREALSASDFVGAQTVHVAAFRGDAVLALRPERRAVPSRDVERQRQLCPAVLCGAHARALPPHARGLDTGACLLDDRPLHVAQGAEPAGTACSEHHSSNRPSLPELAPPRLDHR
jgi:glycosyltransferase involved in cell wall biosynthesis